MNNTNRNNVGDLADPENATPTPGTLARLRSFGNVLTQFAVALSCMSNNGARARSLGRYDDEQTARARFLSASWEPLGFGAEWSRYVTLTRITGPALAPTREAIGLRNLD